MISSAVNTVVSLVLGLVPGSSAVTEPARPDQIHIAVPGGEWVSQGELGEELAEWSNPNMLPGDIAQRAYLVRNLDARAGVWEVRLGDFAISEHGYFGIGTETFEVVGGGVPAKVVVTEPVTGTGKWLLGPEAMDKEGLASSEPGQVLARVEIGSCQAVGFNDWLLFPDVSSDDYQGQHVEPKLQVRFTPIGDESQEFIDGGCPGATPSEPPGPSDPAPPGSSGPAVFSGGFRSLLLVWLVGGLLSTAGAWWPWVVSFGERMYRELPWT